MAQESLIFTEELQETVQTDLIRKISFVANRRFFCRLTQVEYMVVTTIKVFRLRKNATTWHWNDVDVKYGESVRRSEFGGKIDRILPLNEILECLDENQVQFHSDGRTIVVLAVPLIIKSHQNKCTPNSPL